MPPLLTFVARLSDGLPLVASFANTTENLDLQKKQAKEILRNLNSNGRSVAKMSIETTGNTIFHYLIHNNACYLTLTESSYPKRLAFLYLEEIADCFIEFLHRTKGDQYHQVIETTARPYAFIQADPIIQRKQREFVDPKSTANSNKLNQDLSDIHSIMRQNINQVLDRGEKLEQVSQISSNLMDESKKFKWG
jgi:vesicle transport protein SEC22